MPWNGDQPEEETRTAMTAGETVYSHGGLYCAHYADFFGKVYGACTTDGCCCEFEWDTIDDYFRFLRET